jgi:hypothetical protein
MRVKFKSLSAGASGIIRPGDVVEVSDSEGKLLIDRGYADAVDKPEIKAEPKNEPKRGRKK